LCPPVVGSIVHIDHVGVATDDATDLAATYVDLLDCSIAHEETFDGMAVLFLAFDNGYLELLEPQSNGGTIARYLDREGPGLHHVGFETDDAATAIECARNLGIDPIDEEPRSGAWGHDVAFLHPRDTGGILLEFVEHYSNG
jgi:methylmalonyl-CoA/ethylmalonyl-CoA epimerase